MVAIVSAMAKRLVVSCWQCDECRGEWDTEPEADRCAVEDRRTADHRRRINRLEKLVHIDPTDAFLDELEALVARHYDPGDRD